MQLRRRLIPTICGVAALVLAACGDDSSTVVTEQARPGPRQVVFRVDVTGGFVSPETRFAETPSAVVYGDGTSLMPGAMIEIYPGPAYVPLQRGTVSESEIGRLLDLAEELELAGSSIDAGQPPVADAPDTVVTIRTRAGRVVVHRANALGMEEDGSGVLTSEQQDARRRLQQFVTDLQTATGAVADEEFVPDGYLLRAAPEHPETSQPGRDSMEPQPRIKPWPVAAVDLSSAADCVAVTGDAASQVRTTMRQADQLTFFTQDDKSYRVTVRPLLPDETGCPSPK